MQSQEDSSQPSWSAADGPTADNQALKNRLNWSTGDWTIPRLAMTDAELFQLELKRIFLGPTWHLVAHGAEIPEPGDFKTWHIGTVPIAAIRDSSGEIHVLVNACAHRGTKILMEPYGSVRGKLLQCIYHAWTYQLDGACSSVALPQNFPTGFDKTDYDLRKLRTAELGGAVFATFSAETPPLLDYLGDSNFTTEIDSLFKGGHLKFLGSQKVIIDCNWKVYAENVADNYHAVCLHLGTRLLAGKRHSEEINHAPNGAGYNHVWTQIPNAGTDRTTFRDMSLIEVRSKAPDATGLTTRNIMFVFPLSHFYEQGDALSIRYIRPLTVDKVLVHFAAFAGADETAELQNHRVRVTSNMFGPEGLITLEDAAAFSRVQEGAASPGSNYILKGTDRAGPPYPGHSEAGIRGFYSSYRKLMGL